MQNRKQSMPKKDLIEENAALKEKVRRLQQLASEFKQAEEGFLQSEVKYKEMVDFIPIALFETDLLGNVTSQNLAIFRIFGYELADLEKGLNGFQMIVPEDQAKLAENIRVLLSGQEKGPSEYTGMRKDGTTFPVMIFTSVIRQDGKPYGFRGAMLDLTERKQEEEERERLIAELKQALSEIKTLSGLLPICSACKKIRDDRGYWNQIEHYIESHSDAAFSHSICPDCAKRMYPEFYNEKSDDSSK